MTVHDAELVAEMIPLLKEAEKNLGQWINFRIDRDLEFPPAVRWICASKQSPVADTSLHGRSPVIEWRTKAGGWGIDLHAPPVRNENGERIGRIRLRVPHARKKAA